MLDAIARYLAEPRDGLPVELTLDVIRLLALSLPRGPLAPAEHQAQTLAASATQASKDCSTASRHAPRTPRCSDSGFSRAIQ